MQIQSHNLQLASERSYNRSEQQQEQLRIARVSQDPVTGARRVDTLTDISRSERRELLTYSASLGLRADNGNNNGNGSAGSASQSAEARAQALARNASTTTTESAETSAAEAPFELRLEAEDQLKMELISRLHRAITGKEIRLQLVDTGLLNSGAAASADVITPLSSAPASASAPQQVMEPELGLEYERHLRIHERETTSFQARG